MANYANQKAKYGGMVGSIIIHTTSGIGSANDPNAVTFRNLLPAGYLRCDGSRQNAKDYLALARVLGVGDESRFKKENQNLRPEDLSTGDLGEFQLPDLGSKVIIGGRGTGLYQNGIVDDGTVQANPTTRVGPQIEVISNFGNRIEANYIGNARISASGDLNFIGNPRYNMERETSETQLNIDNFQGHAHQSNQKYLNYSRQHETSSTGGKDYAQRLGNSGGGNQLAFSSDWEGESVHKHNLTPTTTYSHNFTYAYDQQDVDMSGVSAYVDVDISDDEKLDQLVTPFTLVEYLIKI
tara:strand:- start:12083 stop:12970 length:888 start_codon:yes stop_codon:yes gene_type:complete